MKHMPTLTFVGKWCPTRRFKTKAPSLPISEKQRIAPSDAAAGDYFSSMVALSDTGDIAVVGAYKDSNARGTNAGGVYVYASVGGTMTLSAKLLPSPGKSTDYFGSSIAVSGDGLTIAVGAYGDDSKASMAGAVYVYRLTNGAWVQQTKLTAADGAKNYYFGMSNVSLSQDGNTLAIGCIQEDHSSKIDAGSVYVYTFSGSTWTQQAKLVANDAAANDFFGSAVSISADGNTVCIGAYQDDNAQLNTGCGYIFQRTGNTWTQQAKLTAYDLAAEDFLGICCDISADGNTAVFGAYQGNIDGLGDAGAVYVFKRTGVNWNLAQKLSAPVPKTFDYFGYVVSISGNGAELLIGAYGDDTVRSGGGCAYLYKDISGVFVYQTKLLPSDTASSVAFGTAVDLSGNGTKALVGSNTTNVGLNSGVAYLFQ